MNHVVQFYPAVPERTTINRNWSCRPSEPHNAWKQPYLQEPATVDSMIGALVRGPFAALAALGPKRYAEAPTQFDGQIPGYPHVPVYGWKPGAERATNEKFRQPIIVCGVQRREGQEQVYYRLAQDFSNPKKAIGTYSLSYDDKVYGVSLKTYNECEYDMFPPVSAEEEKIYESQEVVPTPLAGKPELIEAWKSGRLRCEQLSGGKWAITGASLR